MSARQLYEAMVDVTRRHAEQLEQFGPVRVMALDPCPRCGGTVIASEDAARCTSGCGWRHQEPAVRTTR